MTSSLAKRRRPEPADEGASALMFFGLLSAVSFAAGWLVQGLGGF